MTARPCPRKTATCGARAGLGASSGAVDSRSGSPALFRETVRARVGNWSALVHALARLRREAIDDAAGRRVGGIGHAGPHRSAARKAAIGIAIDDRPHTLPVLRAARGLSADQVPGVAAFVLHG